MATELIIRGMVCERCISVIREGVIAMGIPLDTIRLGRIRFSRELHDDAMHQLRTFLSVHGFELISPREVRLVNEVKAMVSDWFFNHEIRADKTKFSVQVAEKLAMNYDSVSKVFAAQEGITLEKYIIQQRLARVKELLASTGMTLTEIAHATGFSSINHLSGQFRELTGLTPSVFRASIRRPVP